MAGLTPGVCFFPSPAWKSEDSWRRQSCRRLIANRDAGWPRLEVSHRKLSSFYFCRVRRVCNTDMGISTHGPVGVCGQAAVLQPSWATRPPCKCGCAPPFPRKFQEGMTTAARRKLQRFRRRTVGSPVALRKNPNLGGSKLICTPQGGRGGFIGPRSWPIISRGVVVVRLRHGPARRGQRGPERAGAPPSSRAASGAACQRRLLARGWPHTRIQCQGENA